MKKERQVRSYQRRTKSGKLITVRAHTASYEASDEPRKKAISKLGSGDELRSKRNMEDPIDMEDMVKKPRLHSGHARSAGSKRISSVSKTTTKKRTSRSSNLDTVSGQVSYMRKLIKKLPTDKQKELRPFVRKASTGQISTKSLWNKYVHSTSKSRRIRVSYAPWDKSASYDMSHSD